MAATKTPAVQSSTDDAVVGQDVEISEDVTINTTPVVKISPKGVFKRKNYDKDTKQTVYTLSVHHWALIDAAHRARGGIKRWENTVLQIASPDNGNKAVVKCVIEWNDGTLVTGIGAADSANTSGQTSKYLDTMAESRGEARVITKALNVRQLLGEVEIGEGGQINDPKGVISEDTAFMEAAEERVRDVTPPADTGGTAIGRASSKSEGVAIERPTDGRGPLYDRIVVHPQGNSTLIAVAKKTGKSSTAYIGEGAYTQIAEKLKV